MVNKQRAELAIAKFLCIFMQLYPALNFIATLTFGYLEIKKNKKIWYQTSFKFCTKQVD